MKTLSKIMTGAAAAAFVTVSAAPAQAQSYRDYRHYRHHDRGLDAGDIIAGVAIVGGIAAIASAIGRDNDRSGYDYRGYRDDYSNAVNACGSQAERYGRGRVQITDVDRRGRNSYRVRGVIDSYGGYGGGYGYDGYDRDSFTCTARSNGRVTAFRTSDRRGW